jgi:hypothetical protein
MPELPSTPQPEVPVGDDKRSWTPYAPPAAGPTCGPEVGSRSEWRGTAIEAVREVNRRFEGTDTGFVSPGSGSARAVPADELVASMQRVSERYGDAGPVYSVRDDGSIYNTVTNRTEYVPVCLARQPAGTPTPTATPTPTSGPDLATRNNPTVQDLQTLFTRTELGGNANLQYRFSYAGNGNSAYSFGINQFDVGANPSARQFLAGAGFTTQEVQQLSQHGGLSAAALAPLDAKLQAHAQDVDQFTAPYLANYVTRVNALVTDLQTANPTAAAAIAGDRTLQLALIDFDNQYTIGGVGGGTVAANGMLSYLRGNQVTLPGGALKLQGAPTLADIQGFARATKYAVDHPSSVENRIQQFNTAAASIDAAHAAP